MSGLNRLKFRTICKEVATYFKALVESAFEIHWKITSFISSSLSFLLPFFSFILG
jgi:hypothetical protein